MPLRTIISPVAAQLGLKLTSVSERQMLLDDINAAAKEIYDLNQLPGCTREQVFQVDSQTRCIALPSYVEQVLAIRDYEGKMPIVLETAHPTYQSNNWLMGNTQLTAEGYYIWRYLGSFAISRPMNDQTHLKLTFPDVNVLGAIVTVIGSTEHSAKVTEIINFSTTEKEKTTQNVWKTISRIQKTTDTDYDLTVSDDDNVVLSRIPNNEDTAFYKYFQLFDENPEDETTLLIDDWIVQVLYKTKFIPVVEDTDSFVFGDTFDDVILYMTLARRLATQQGQEDRAGLAFQNAQRLLAGISKAAESNFSNKINFGNNQVYTIFNKLTCGAL